jgi:Na+-transporting NADH:ubiquinone oxidoreductase subunit NqrD
MNVRSALIALGACLALCAIAALAFDWSFEKALILSPIIVLVAGAAGFLVVLWGRIVLDSIRGRRERA